MKQLAIINPENVLEKEVEAYLTRDAARAVIFDENKSVALLYVSAEGSSYIVPRDIIFLTEAKKYINLI